jgi:hypothetical protein
MVNSSPEIDDILKEIALQNVEEGWKLTNPYARLGVQLTVKMLELHNFNTKQELMLHLRQTMVGPEIIEMFKEL